MAIDWSQLGTNLSQLPANPLFDLGLGLMANGGAMPYGTTMGQRLVGALGDMGTIQKNIAQQQYVQRLRDQAEQDRQTLLDNKQKVADALQNSPYAKDPSFQALALTDPTAAAQYALKRQQQQALTNSILGAPGQPNFTPPTPRPANGLPSSLPQETQNYVAQIKSIAGDAPLFDSFGQPTAALLDAQRQVESGGNNNAVSSAGAQGPYQFMPGTAKMLGLQNPFDPVASRRAAATYDRQMFDKFGGNPALALAAYNAGPGTLQAAIQRAQAATQGTPAATQSAPATAQQNPLLSNPAFRQLAAADPAAALKLEVEQATKQTAGRFQTLTADQLKANGLPSDAVAQMGPDGQIHVVQKGSEGFQGGNVPLPGDVSLTGQAYIDSITNGDPFKGIAPDPGTAQLATSYLNRTLPMPASGTAIKNPQIRAAMLAAEHADPTLNAGSFDIAKATRLDAAKGKIGATIGAIDTALPHLRQLAADVVALDNGQTGFVNAGTNFLRRQTNNFYQGHTKGTPSTNLQGDLTQVVSEMAQVYKASGATDEEIGQFRDAFPTNSSKDQQINMMRHWIGLLYGKLGGAATQYQNGVGGMAKPLTIVNQQAQGALAGIQQIANSLGMSQDDLTKEAQDVLGPNGSMPGGQIANAPQQFHGPGAQPSATPQAAAAHPGYPNGTRLNGPGGKTYVVQNGVPVPESP